MPLDMTTRDVFAALDECASTAARAATLARLYSETHAISQWIDETYGWAPERLVGHIMAGSRMLYDALPEQYTIDLRVELIDWGWLIVSQYIISDVIDINSRSWLDDQPEELHQDYDAYVETMRKNHDNVSAGLGRAAIFSFGLFRGQGIDLAATTGIEIFPRSHFMRDDAEKARIIPVELRWNQGFRTGYPPRSLADVMIQSVEAICSSISDEARSYGFALTNNPSRDGKKLLARHNYVDRDQLLQTLEGLPVHPGFEECTNFLRCAGWKYKMIHYPLNFG